MPLPAIEVKDLCKRYGSVTAVDRVNLTVERGEIVGFLGPNGAGKSTTMRIVAGLMPATSGIAYISGIPVAWHPEEARSHLGYMPENNPLPEEMRVTEYLRWRARLKGVSNRQVAARVDEVMESCDLVRKARRCLIGTLSKGFRQRVGIADALLGFPDVIILDEPTIGLDPHQIMAIRRLIKELRGKVSVLISSHILPEIEQVCDRVIIINQGRIVASGTPDDLRDEFMPETEFLLIADLSALDVEAILLPFEPKVRVVNKGVVPSGNARRFVVTMPSTSSLAPVLLEKLWETQPGRVRELHGVVPSLEDVFVAATRRSWEMKTKIKNTGATPPGQP
jgi:ABC-2 type transport system ATP-binding protein